MFLNPDPDYSLPATWLIPSLAGLGVTRYQVAERSVGFYSAAQWGACEITIAPLAQGLWFRLRPKLFAEKDDIDLLLTALASNSLKTYIKLGLTLESGEIVFDLDVPLLAPPTKEDCKAYLALARSAINDLMPRLLRVKWGGLKPA